MSSPPLGFRSARRPGRVVLEGARVVLEPLDAARHAADLWTAGHGPGADPHGWTYLPYGPFADPGALADWIRAEAVADDPLFLAVVQRATGRAAGVVAFLEIVPAHGTIEIGHVWFGHALQRTPAATEAVALLARHAFEVLGNRRLEWKCDAANARSRRAAERFGFTAEGIFRQHRVVRDRNRDTAWFSLLDREWPRAGAAFDAWLHPANFGPDGRQRHDLAALRGALG